MSAEAFAALPAIIGRNDIERNRVAIMSDALSGVNRRKAEARELLNSGINLHYAD